MALAACTECGREVSTKAKACPGCGAPPPKPPRPKLPWKGGLAVLFSLLLLGAIFGEPTDSSADTKNGEIKQPAKSQTSYLTEENRRAIWIEKGKDAVRLKLKDPDSAQFRKTYFHRGKSGVPVACGQVNAKNSMGGYSGFQRFVSGTTVELTYLEKEVSGFAKVWNELCVK